MKDEKSQPLFLKLGGSLITDKTRFEMIREDVLKRVAAEIAQVLKRHPAIQLLLGHGSGSFGHTHAQKHGTRTGVHSLTEWRGFTEVSDSALRLNRAVVGALVAAGVPAISISPSGSAVVADGSITEMALAPIMAALAAGLVPVIHGDVAFDQVRGGTILSTEEIMSFLAPHLHPSRLLLAGETAGVYDHNNQVIPHISDKNFDQVKTMLGGSRGADVTGGMATKVRDMLMLSKEMQGLDVVIFTGLEAGNIVKMLEEAGSAQFGTTIKG